MINNIANGRLNKFFKEYGKQNYLSMLILSGFSMNFG